MQRKSLIMAVVIMVCFSMFLSGCNAAKDVDNANGSGITSPTPTTSTTGLALPIPIAPTNNGTQTSDSITPTASPTETSTPSVESQTPSSTPTSQINPSESASESALEIDLSDGKEVSIIVSGQKAVTGMAVIMGGEVFVLDYNYVFENLKGRDGIENAGFLSYFAVDTTKNIETAVITNAQYYLKIVEGEYSFTCNDETMPLTIPAQTINGRFAVPLIALSEAINATVEWNEATQTILFFY